MRESREFRINTRNRLVKEQKNICAFCKKPMKKATLEHIIPLELSEHNYEEYPENFLAVCNYCNKTKGSHIIFSNIYDKELYIMVDIPYIFHYNFIVNRNKKDRRES